MPRSRQPPRSFARSSPSTVSGEQSPVQGFAQTVKSVVQRVRLDLALADRARVGDRMPVAHHVDAPLRRADQPRARDLDPRPYLLLRAEVPQHAHRRQPVLAANLVDAATSVGDRLVQRLELLPPDTRPVPDRHLPLAHPSQAYVSGAGGYRTRAPIPRRRGAGA